MRGRATRITVLLGTGLAATVAGIGHAAPLPLTGTLDLGAEADLRIDGAAADQTAGFRVAGAGDVNGDGKADLIVGAPATTVGNRMEAGRAYVLFGASGQGPITPALLAQRGLRIDGAAGDDHLGFSVAGAGDVNGDGLADVVVGAPTARNARGERSGAAYVVLGRAAPGAIDLAAPGSAALRVQGAESVDLFGAAVAGGTDVSGDGKPDVVVGAPGARSADRGRTGAAYVVTAPSGELDAAALGDAGYELRGLGPGDLAGFSVAVGPDSSGDGRGEIVVGAPGLGDGAAPTHDSRGAAYVVFGQAGSGPVELALLKEGGITMIGAGGTLGAAGHAVAALGDVNGDTRPDYAIGAPLADPQDRDRAGSVFVVYGGPAGDVPLPAPAGRGVRIDGSAANDNAGLSIAGIGPKPDFDGDAIADIVIGAPGAAPLSRIGAGAAYVVFGAAQPANVDLAQLGPAGVRFAGAAASEAAGSSVAAAGDVNADGTPDVAIHAPKAMPDGKTVTSATYLVSAPAGPGVTGPADPGVAEEVAAGCEASTNAEVIVDDSGSMADTDPKLLRRRAVELLVGKPRNEGKVLGAVEFGSTANTVFNPAPLQAPGKGSNQGELDKALLTQIGADNGGTNYNAGFEFARQENIAADTRIFLTDGAHNEGPYEDLHRGGPRTFVIGLGIGSKGPDAKRLRRIAQDTGGRYFAGVTDERLGTVVNQIDSLSNCDVGLATDPEVVTDDEETPLTSTPLDGGTHSVDVTLTWTNPKSSFALDKIEVFEGGARVAALGRQQLLRARRPGVHRFGKIRVRSSFGATFGTYRVSGVDGGRLRTTTRVRQLRGKTDTLITQVAQSRRRR